MLSTTTRSAWPNAREAGDDDVVVLAGTLDRAGDPSGLEAELA